MRQPFDSRVAVLSSLLLLPTAINAVSIDCKKLVADSVSFNFEKLGGSKSVINIEEHGSGLLNTTYTVDICDGLKVPKGEDKNHKSCPQGTRVCAFKERIDGKNHIADDPFPIARNDVHGGASFDPVLTRLRTTDSNADSDKEGLRVELNGGKIEEEEKKQRAIIEFLCKRPEDEKKRLRRDDGEKDDDKEKDGDDKKDDKDEDWDKLRETQDGEGGTLRFLKYQIDGDMDTLRMEWNTKYACEDYAESDGSSPSGGWGFFSWFFLLLFLGLFGYFTFFAWVNYSKYGAQGWDLVPHSDTIRDIPYILGDWGRKVVGTFTGGGSRGGYSAV